MKRQKSTYDFISNKIPKPLVSSSNSVNNYLSIENEDNNINDENILNVLSSVNVSLSEEDSHEKNLLPDCWTSEQAQYFLNKYNGLIIEHKKLGCFHCSNISKLEFLTGAGKSLHVSSEWRNCTIKACGIEKKTQQSSLRKKMKEHFESISHLRVINILNKSKKKDSFKTEVVLENDCASSEGVEISRASPDITSATHDVTKASGMESRVASDDTSWNMPAKLSTSKAPSKKMRCNMMSSENERISSESVVEVGCSDLQYKTDEFDSIGHNVAVKLRSLEPVQRIIAEKLISDVLFNAQLESLNISSTISTPCHISQTNINSNSDE